MFLLDLPFVATGVHVMVPFWPELTLLWTAWLTFPLTAGAPHHGGCRAARRGLVGGGRRRRARAPARARRARAPRVGASASFFFPIRRVRRWRAGSERAQQSLRGVAYGLRFLGLIRAGAALGLALDNACR